MVRCLSATSATICAFARELPSDRVTRALASSWRRPSALTTCAFVHHHDGVALNGSARAEQSRKAVRSSRMIQL
eukprot:5054599-Prymnesium_polylepis.1